MYILSLPSGLFSPYQVIPRGLNDVHHFTKAGDPVYPIFLLQFILYISCGLSSLVYPFQVFPGIFSTLGTKYSGD